MNGGAHPVGVLGTTISAVVMVNVYQPIGSVMTEMIVAKVKMKT